MPIRLIAAEDNYLVREGLRQALAALEDVELLEICEDLPSVLDALGRLQPDLLLTDIRMPPTHTDEGIQAAEQARTISPRTAVVALSQYVESEYALALLDKGAAGRGYLLKERVADLDHLGAALREVARGGSVIDPRVVEALVADRARREPSPLSELTPREIEVLAAVAEGKNNAAIGRVLFLTERAVEKHINSIFSKLQLTEDADINRRVKATLMYLAERG